MVDYFSQYMTNQRPVTGVGPVSGGSGPVRLGVTPTQTTVAPPQAQRGAPVPPRKPTPQPGLVDLGAIPPSVGPNGEQFSLFLQDYGGRARTKQNSHERAQETLSPNVPSPNLKTLTVPTPNTAKPDKSDLGRTLMEFGLATMAAGAQPGASTASAIGQGGMAALKGYDSRKATRADQARQARMDQLTERRVAAAEETAKASRIRAEGANWEYVTDSSDGILRAVNKNDPNKVVKVTEDDGTPVTLARRSGQILTSAQAHTIAKDMNTNQDGTVDWRGVEATLADIESGKSLSEIAGRQAQGGAQVDELTAMTLADTITLAMANPLLPDSLDDGFDVTGGDRELFAQKIQNAIRTGDRGTAYRLVGDDEDAIKILNGHFAGQEQPAKPKTREAGFTPSAPLPLPEGGAAALVVGQWYQTPRGPRKFLGWSEENGQGNWEVPGESNAAPNLSDEETMMRNRDGSLGPR